MPAGRADWTAGWFHRKATFVRNEWAGKELGHPYEKLSAEYKGKLRGRLEATFRGQT